jgi:hypothetical protein
MALRHGYMDALAGIQQDVANPPSPGEKLVPADDWGQPSFGVPTKLDNKFQSLYGSTQA